MNDYDVWVIELDVPPSRALMLQAWLLGEDGLGVIRCFASKSDTDAEKRKQQFWTTVCQREDALDWLKQLPEFFAVTGEWLWRDDG